MHFLEETRQRPTAARESRSGEAGGRSRDSQAEKVWPLLSTLQRGVACSQYHLSEVKGVEFMAHNEGLLKMRATKTTSRLPFVHLFSGSCVSPRAHSKMFHSNKTSSLNFNTPILAPNEKQNPWRVCREGLHEAELFLVRVAAFPRQTQRRLRGRE